MRANDNINHPKGVVNVRIFDAQGVEVLNETDHNLVLIGGYQLLPRLLCGINNHITHIAVGENGTPPKESDIELLNPCFVEVNHVDFPTPRSVRFSSTFDYGDAVGLSIQELGLYTPNGVLFSRKVRQPLEKTQHMSIAVSWDINF